MLKTESLEVRVDPRAEWGQMYHEVWRLERDFFYDTNYHGLDLKAAEKRYESYLDNLASRRDLNYLFEEMLGELSVSHLFIGGGDSPEVKSIETGLLGADYSIENGRYRFTRVYSGENWNPDLKAPLTQPGLNVVAGEYLLAVNGRELRAADNIYSFFEGAAGKQVVLKVGPDPSGANAREVTVTPLADDFRLRRLAWIEDNRRKVDQMSNGRVAYIHMPDTSSGGYTSFHRYFFAQVGKQGAIFGPKVMIINEFAGSGGDLLPWYFRRFGVGKLIGKRTWGGVVGLAGYPGLMDGGAVTAPSALIWNPNGQWEIENQGVARDIEVELDPMALRQGHDPQLEKAVAVLMEELKKNPLPQPKHRPYPKYRAAEAANGVSPGFQMSRGLQGERAWGGFKVSGNGTRFVWHGGDAQQEQVVKAALVDGVKTGLVAMDEAELRQIGQSGKGGGDAAQLVSRLLGVDGIIEEAGFHGPDAAEAPGGGDHLLDKAEFDAIGGREPSEMLMEEGFEALLRLVGEDEVLGEEPVADGVLGRAPLPLRSLGSQRAGAVGPRGKNASQ